MSFDASEPASSPAEAAHSPGEVPPGPRRALVLFLILATGVIFLGLFALLYFRWAGAQEPSSAIIVAITPAFEGAEIVVDGAGLAAPYRVVAGEQYRSEIPFFLDRGSYTLHVRHGGKTIYSGDFILKHNDGRRIDLAKIEHLLPPRAETAPAELDAAPRSR